MDSSGVDEMNAVYARLGVAHRIVPGTLIGPDIALLFALMLERIETLERLVIKLDPIVITEQP